MDGSRAPNRGVLRIPGKALGRGRDGQQRQERGDKTQDRIEPRQNVIQPNEPIGIHVHQPVASWIDDVIVVPRIDERNLECPNRAFGELEGYDARGLTYC
jgi:hypothetical protein